MNLSVALCSNKSNRGNFAYQCSDMKPAYSHKFIARGRFRRRNSEMSQLRSGLPLIKKRAEVDPTPGRLKTPRFALASHCRRLGISDNANRATAVVGVLPGRRPGPRRGCGRLPRRAAGRGSRAPSTDRSAPPRSARGNAASSPGLPKTTACVHLAGLSLPRPRPSPRRRHPLPAAAASLPPGARRGRRLGSQPLYFSFRPGTAADTSHPGARWRRRPWGPGA